MRNFIVPSEEKEALKEFKECRILSEKEIKEAFAIIQIYEKKVKELLSTGGDGEIKFAKTVVGVMIEEKKQRILFLKKQIEFCLYAESQTSVEVNRIEREETEPWLLRVKELNLEKEWAEFIAAEKLNEILYK